MIPRRCLHDPVLELPPGAGREVGNGAMNGALVSDPERIVRASISRLT